MTRGPQRLEAFAQALATGVPPVEAAKLAGYPQGSQFAASARRRARRKDVRAIVAELQKPVKEKLAKTVEANFAWATEKLMSIASAKLDLWNIKASDKIRAIEVLAKMHGWNAPEKREVNAQAKVERIELVFVDPPTRGGTNL
jgi:hypothetical protein